MREGKLQGEKGTCPEGQIRSGSDSKKENGREKNYHSTHRASAAGQGNRGGRAKERIVEVRGVILRWGRNGVFDTVSNGDF